MLVQEWPPVKLIFARKIRLVFDRLKPTEKKMVGLISRVFANGPVDQGSIPGQVIPRTQKKKKLYVMPPCLTLSIIR